MSKPLTPARLALIAAAIDQGARHVLHECGQHHHVPRHTPVRTVAAEPQVHTFPGPQVGRRCVEQTEVIAAGLVRNQHHAVECVRLNQKMQVYSCIFANAGLF